MQAKNKTTKKTQQKDMFTKMSQNARHVLLVASRLADFELKYIQQDPTDKGKVYPIHLFAGILLTPQSLASKTLLALGIDPINTIKKLGFDQYIEIPKDFVNQEKTNKSHNEIINTEIPSSPSREESSQVLTNDNNPSINQQIAKMAETFLNRKLEIPPLPLEINSNIETSKNIPTNAKKIPLNTILSNRVTSTESAKIIVLSDEIKKIISNAYQIANKYDLVYVGTEHLLISLLAQKNSQFVQELKKSGLSSEIFLKTLSTIASYPVGLLIKPEPHEKNRAEMPVLSQLGVELVELAKADKLDPIVGREDEIDQIINILSRRKKNNPIVVGEAGVGKTALIEGLAQRIANGSVPGSLQNSKIYSLDITNIVAGSKLRGDIEEKMLEIINEVKSRDDTILFIDEIHNILMTGSQAGGIDISSILKPALVNGDFRCIGATSTADYTRYFEEETALARRFQSVFIEEPNIEDSIEILRNIKPLLEKHHNVLITEEALTGAVKLADRFVSERFLPDKAIDLLDEATASRRLEVEVKYKEINELEKKYSKLEIQKEKLVREGKLEEAKKLRIKEAELSDIIDKAKKDRSDEQSSKKYEVGIDTVRKIVSKWTGIPVATINQDETTALINLEKTMSKSVIGQREAVNVVAAAIKRARAGISSAERPWASFLFLGPTGVGKTELAKVLTKTLFGDEDRLIQVDMSEMMEMHSVSKLIGSPPGYVGYREGGQLTEAVAKKPHSVILFDEIEKAHPDVLNILLQILEYGHLTDGKGRKVNFKNTIIILTSNIGAEEIRKSKILGFVADKEDIQKSRSDADIEQAYDSMREMLQKELKESLRPELLNRLDDIVIFRALKRTDAEKIVEILIRELNERLSEEKVAVKLDKKAVALIVKDGFSEEYGARPLRRLLQDKVESFLADWLLRNGIKSDHQRKIGFTVSKGKIAIESAR